VVVAVSDPAHPVEVGQSDTPGYACGVAATGNYACVANYHDPGLCVISVADPAHPAEVGHCSTTDLSDDVAADRSYAYVAAYQAGLRVFSIADPTQPNEAGHYDTPGNAWGVTANTDYVFVADDTFGLEIYQFYGTGVQETMNDGRATRNVRPAVIRSLPQGATAFDAMGRRALNPKSGVYFVREAQAQAQAVRKVVISR
jgi:hypothetical protein